MPKGVHSSLSGLPRVALASVSFGLAGVFSAVANEHGAGARDALAFRSFALLPLLVLLFVPARRALVRGALGPLLAMAALSTFNVTSYFTAVSLMSPALVGLLIYGYPAIVIVGSHLLGWRRLDALTLLAAGVALGGVVLTIGMPDGDVHPAGVALSLANAFMYAAYILFAQRTLRDVDPVTTVAFVGGVSSVALLAGITVLGFHPPSEGKALTNLLLIALVSTLVGHLLIMSGISRLGGTWSALTSCLEVVTAVVATAIVLDDPLGPGAVAGGALVILGGVAAPILAVRGRAAARTRPKPAPVKAGP